MINYRPRSLELQRLAAVLLIGLAWSTAQPTHADEAVPVLWNGMDIGSPQPAGIDKTDGNTITLAGGGELAGVSDNFHFVYQAVSGDCTLTAHLASPNNSANAGLMARDALATTSNFVALLSSPGRGAESIYRTVCSPVISTVEVDGGAPAWLKLVKRGSIIQNYMAADLDGSHGTWKQIGSAQHIATGMVYIGLCLTSHTQATAGTAVFDHVSLITGPQPPVDNGVFTISPASAPGMYLTANGPVANIAIPVNAENQKWLLVNKGNNFYSIQPASTSSAVLSVPGAKSDNGTKVAVLPDQGQNTQLWSLVSNSNGTYCLLPKFNTDIALDDYGGVTTPDAVIDIWATTVRTHTYNGH